MRKLNIQNLLLILLILKGLSSCALQVPNVKACAVKGVLSSGAICAHSNTDDTLDLTFDEFLYFLEPDVNRGGAICIPPKDWASIKTFIEQTCGMKDIKCIFEQ